MDKNLLGQAVVIGRESSGYWAVDVTMGPGMVDRGNVRKYFLRVMDFHPGTPVPGDAGEAFFVSNDSVGFVVVQLSGFRRELPAAASRDAKRGR